jgi:hypothetical protein
MVCATIQASSMRNASSRRNAISGRHASSRRHADIEGYWQLARNRHTFGTGTYPPCWESRSPLTKFSNNLFRKVGKPVKQYMIRHHASQCRRLVIQIPEFQCRLLKVFPRLPGADIAIDIEPVIIRIYRSPHCPLEPRAHHPPSDGLDTGLQDLETLRGGAAKDSPSIRAPTQTRHGAGCEVRCEGNVGHCGKH